MLNAHGWCIVRRSAKCSMSISFEFIWALLFFRVFLFTGQFRAIRTKDHRRLSLPYPNRNMRAFNNGRSNRLMLFATTCDYRVVQWTRGVRNLIVWGGRMAGLWASESSRGRESRSLDVSRFVMVCYCFSFLFFIVQNRSMPLMVQNVH